MVNLDAARRQALGTHFRPSADEDAKVNDLKAGRLTMAPHKAWSLPGEPTWRENPFQDNNWQFQYHMLRWLDPLRRAANRGDVEAAQRWEFLAHSWITANPPGAGQTRWSWIDMSDGIRAMELCHGLTVVGEQEWLLSSLHDHVAWLSEPSHLKRGNHGFHQHVGLFVLGVVLEDPEVTELALERLFDQLAAAYDEQGANEEGSLGYHLQNYEWWNDALRRLDLEGIPRPELSHRLDQAPQLLAHATSPLGRFARIGDTDGGNPRRINHPLTRFVVTQGREGTKPDTTTAVYDAGYAFLRSGWGEDRPYQNETFVTAVWGRQDKAHGHRDGGSVTFAADGVQWIDDSGKYYYGKSPMRDYVVGRESHNVVVVPGRTYRRDTEVSLLGRTETGDYVNLIFGDPGYDDVGILRRLIYLKARRQLLVLDSVETPESTVVEQRWNCGRGVEAQRLRTGFILRREKKSIHVSTLNGGPTEVRRGEKNPLAGWTSTGWRRASPVDQLAVTGQGPSCFFPTLIGPWDEAAVDVLGSRMTPDALHGRVEDVLPSALLARDHTVSVVEHAQDNTGMAVTVSRTDRGLVRVVVRGGGPLYAFYLFRSDGAIERTPYNRRASRTFYADDSASCRIRVFSRDDAQTIMVRTVTAA